MADEEIEYISVVQGVKLISRTFDGNPKHLREFCEGDGAASDPLMERLSSSHSVEAARLLAAIIRNSRQSR
jgi:hypothetical protein